MESESGATGEGSESALFAYESRRVRIGRQDAGGMAGLTESLGWAQAWPWAKRVAMEVEADVQQLGSPWAEAWTEAWAKERAWWMTAWARAMPWGAVWAEAEALTLAEVWAWSRGEARARGERVPSGLADSSTIWRILTSLNLHATTRHLWQHSPERNAEYGCIVHFIAPITRLPFELLRHIFLLIIDETGCSPLVLMLVCNHWYAMVTSIWASLSLGTTTPMDAITKKLGRNQWLLDIVVDTDSDRGDFTSSNGAFEAIFAAIEASSRWRSLVVKSFLAQSDLPEDVVKRRLQRCSNATMSRFTTFKVKSACETSPLLNSLLRILGTTASSELTTVEINSENVISFLVPNYSSIFHSVKVLSLDTPGIPNPVDLLPHLHHLETFTASHISFSTYHNDVNSPFVHTLRYLSLRAASIQWMSGRTFHILEHCTIIFPLQHHILPTFRTTLPNCKHLTFQGYPLEVLGGVSAHKLTQLSVICSGALRGRGSQQLVWLSSQVLGESRLRPQILHIGVEATNRAWVIALGFMSDLEELVIQNARPSSLGAEVFQSLLIQPVHASNLGAKSTPGESSALLCPLLRRFGLKYDRWLRPSEEFDLIPVFKSIIQSRQHSDCSLESFSLWMSRGQKDPLELIEGSEISAYGFDGLRRLTGGRIRQL